MPNRILKESICSSDNLNTLKPEEEILFYRLIVNCDDFGTLDARPQIIKSKCFPLKTDEISNEDIEKWLHGLCIQKIITIYEVGGKRYLKMNTWEKHQRIRAKKSKYPLPSEDSKIIDGGGQITYDNNSLSNDSECLQHADTLVRNPIQSKYNPNPNPNPNTNPTAEINKTLNQDADKKNKKDNNKNKGFDEIINAFTTDENLKNAILDFIKMRKAVKKPLTDKALQLNLNKLNTLATDDDTKIAILNQSIMNSWKSVYPLKNDNQQNSNNGNEIYNKNVQAGIDIVKKLREEEGANST